GTRRVRRHALSYPVVPSVLLKYRRYSCRRVATCSSSSLSSQDRPRPGEDRTFRGVVWCEQAIGGHMPVEVCEKRIDFIAERYDQQSPGVRAFGLDDRGKDLSKGEDRRLQCLVALMGETAPLLSPLSPNYGITEEMHPVRFDWTFGVSDLP